MEKVNQYSGKCVECGHKVEKWSGIVRRQGGGKWQVYCFGCAVADKPADPGMAAYETAQQDVAYTEAMNGNWAGGGLR